LCFCFSFSPAAGSLNELEKMDPGNKGLTELFDHYLDKLLVERDRRYEDRSKALHDLMTAGLRDLKEFVIAGFKESKEAVAAALAAQKEITSNAFVASEKAIVKAEESQRETNNKSNEFRGQLKDQNETMIPRLEAHTKFQALDEKLDQRQVATDRRLDELAKNIAALRENAALYPSRNEVNTMFGSITKDISDLRESRSEGKGGQQTKREASDAAKWAVGIGVALLGLAITLLLFYARGPG